MTSSSLSGLDREAAQARCEAATEGPWESYGNSVFTTDRATVAITHRAGWARDASNYQREADAEFIAAARTDLPLALRALSVLEAENAELRTRIAAALAVDASHFNDPEERRLAVRRALSVGVEEQQQ